MTSPEYEAASDYPLTSIDSIDQSTPFLHDSGDTSPVTDPPSFAQGSPSPAGAAGEPRSLTFVNGLAILLGVQIGSGIFSVPSQVSQHVPSPAIGVAAWIAGGLLVMTGAASLIELGLAITEHGGMQEYLRCCYNDFAAFLFTSVWVGIAKPCSMAVIATVFAEHACEILLSKAASGVVLTKAIAILGVLSIAAINCAGARSGVKVANLFLVLKIGALVSIVLLGFVRASMGLGKGVWSEDDNHGWFDSPDHEKVAPWIMIGNLVTALLGALFCYSGWESIGFVAAELANPTRDLPRILTVGVTIVTIGFTLTNVSLYLILPFDTIRSHYTVVIQFAKQVLGTYGAVIYSFIVALSCLGALNANIIATSALCVAASDRGYFPKVFSNRSYVPLESDFVLQHTPTWSFQGLALRLRRKLDESRMKTNAPVYPVLLNSSLACIYIAVGTFNGLITFIGISEYLFFFFGIAGVFVIRARHSSLETPPPAVRTWSGNPIIFCTVSAFIVIQGILKDPLQGVFILVTVFFGWIRFRIMNHGYYITPTATDRHH